MFGTLGALLAGPMTAMMIVIMASFDDTRWLAILFSAEDSPLVTDKINDAEEKQEKQFCSCVVALRSAAPSSRC